MRRTRRPRGEHGAAAVEFALVMVPLIALVFGIIQYGVYFWAMQGGADAARQAARLASVGDPATCAGLTTRVSAGVKPVSAASNGLLVYRTFSKPDGTVVVGTAPVAIGDTVTVKVRFKTFDFDLPYVPFVDDGWVESTAVARVDSVDNLTAAPDTVCNDPNP